MRLYLTEKEARVVRACLEEGSKLMLRLISSPYADIPTKQMAKHDSLVISCIRNKIDKKLQTLHK